MKQYLDLMKTILTDGEDHDDRTGVGIRSYFGTQSRYDLRSGFPAVTTKKIAWKSVVSELLWFLEGSSDERRLAEILFGTRDLNKKTIWTANANADYWKNGKYDGDLGRIYGKQWRDWRSPIINGMLIQGATTTDQIKNIIKNIKEDPFSRRHIITAWNPGEIENELLALPPCHLLVQFYVSSKRELSCQMYQRSADVPLGVPFNIASYSLLTHMIAQVCELDVGEFIHTIGDAHIYNNQISGANQQILREPLSAPTLWLNPKIMDIDKFTMNDIQLDDYDHHPNIEYPFSV
jgi:thymidylate synthase